MVVRDSIFDVLLFGVLALALALDRIFPQLHGVATVFAVGLATYLAAQEMACGLARRPLWTQESLTTSVALSALGFLYYFGRNGSDIILVILSLAFMMTSLMMLIAIVAAIGAAWHGKSVAPLLGWIATFAGALVLGAFAGVLILVLTSDLPIALRFALFAVGFALAKMRAMSRRTANQTPTPHDTSSTRNAFSHTETPDNSKPDDDTRASAAEMHAGSWTLQPERGTLLERFAPILLVGALAFVFLSQTRRNAAWPSASAQAATSSLQNSVSSP